MVVTTVLVSNKPPLEIYVIDDVGTGVGVGVAVGVEVEVGVGVGVDVTPVKVWVGVDVGVEVGVEVGVPVPVAVGVPVGVAVPVGVGVEVGVLVGPVAVGVGVAVGVLVEGCCLTRMRRRRKPDGCCRYPRDPGVRVPRWSVEGNCGSEIASIAGLFACKSDSKGRAAIVLQTRRIEQRIDIVSEHNAGRAVSASGSRTELSSAILGTPPTR